MRLPPNVPVYGTRPRSWPAAPAITMSGRRCSSRGWACRAAGASVHRASWASRVAGSASAAFCIHASNASDTGPIAGFMNWRRLWKLMPLPTRSTPSERSERAPDREVARRIEPLLERELDRRHVGVRVRQFERDERAVVEPAGRVFGRRKAGDVEQLADLRRELGCSRGGPRDLVRLG